MESLKELTNTIITTAFEKRRNKTKWFRKIKKTY
jgi:hypothetical protein